MEGSSRDGFLQCCRWEGPFCKIFLWQRMLLLFGLVKARLSRIPMAEVSFPGVIGYRRRPEEIRGALEYNIASNDHSFPFLCPRQTAIIYQSIYELLRRANDNTATLPLKQQCMYA
ncbi:hypothetical protein RvY_01035-4 [Ramazzottius varieornatus]|uniref:Uncharacterized protein n=1 Tax=Ramazzottius varieornatus TaxID=947166 RepID=A0A1D1UPM7_RAMVA|nr:hypothetical protein RvY_01035-4 [Ramazzottius varieornatus]